MDQMAVEQHDKSPNEQIEVSSQFSITELEESEEAHNGEESFWFSWYNAIMLLGLGFFIYYFPRLTGFPVGAFHVTDIIAGIIDSIGFLLALILLLNTLSKVLGSVVTYGLSLFLCTIPLITGLRLATTKHNSYSEFAQIFLMAFQIIALLTGVLVIYVVFYILYMKKPTGERASQLSIFLRNCLMAQL